MPYKLKKIGDRIGVYNRLNNKFIKKFKTRKSANKMIKIWNNYERTYIRRSKKK